jgi:membrane fusion protein, heavy metal efflux system
MLRLSILSILVAACSSSSASPGSAQPAPEPPSAGVRLEPESLRFVEVKPVGNRGGNVAVRAPARVTFREGALSKIGSPVSGRVVAVHVKVGDVVKKGDRLLSIHSSEAASASAELAAAAVAVRAAKSDLDRQKRMLDRGVGIESEKVAAEMRLAEAEARASAGKRLSGVLGASGGGSIVVRSPIDGVVLARRTSAGAAVSSDADGLIEIGDPHALWVVADVFEADIPLVGAGAKARIELGTSSAALEGTVVSVSQAVDPALRRAPVYIELAASEQLRAGMYARVTLETEDRQAIAVPAEAVLVKENDRHIVFVTHDGSTFVARDVKVGKPAAGSVPVLAGLEPGERIVTRGAILLDGAAGQLL